METCKVDGCEVKKHAKGFCSKHYGQICNHGRILKRTKFDPNEFIVNGDIATIILYDPYGIKTGEAIIDKDDIEIARKYKWRIDRRGPITYCKTGTDTMYLHTLISGCKRTDHRNHDGLDNRKVNLRLATPTQNAQNKLIPNNNTSGFKGVHKHRRKWQATIQDNGIKKFIGSFDTPHMAAVAYNEAAKKLFGEFAYLNQVQS